MRRLILILCLLPALATAQDRLDCALKAAGKIKAKKIILNCGLTEEEAAVFQSMLKELLNRQIQMQDLLIRSTKQTQAYIRLLEAGVTEAALIELARRVSVDVQDPAQAFAELQKAVGIAIKVQQEARNNPSTDEFVAEVQRRVADLARTDLAAADALAEDAVAKWDEQQEEQRRRGIELLRISFDQNVLAGKLEQAASKRVRIADLEADGEASLSALRRISEEHYVGGLRYGASSDLRLAINITNIALERAQSKPARAILLNDNGNRFQILGTRTGGAEGADLLADAVTAYRAALEVRTRADHPVDWAMTQNNLGNALANQGTRSGDAEGADLLAEAVTAFRAALEVRTRADHPVDWATTQNNLGNALAIKSTRTGGAAVADLLAEAVTAYRAALAVTTRADHPVDWAMTQNNLGNALAEQGSRTGGVEGAALLAEAVAAYRAALEVRTRADHPVDWATTQNNLGAALQEQGTRTGGAEGADLLAEAVTAFRAALEVRTRADHPVDWARTQENIAIAELDRARHEATDAPRPHLKAALAAVEEALEVFDPEHLSYNHQKATRLRDQIRAKLDSHP